MSIPDNTEIVRQGGRFNAQIGMLLTAADVEDMGEIGIQNLMHFLMMLFYDTEAEVPMSGFPRDSDSVQLGNCRVAFSGDLAFDVDRGWGLLFDATQIGADEFGSDAYRMLALDPAGSGTLDAHDVNPRIDLITLQPARVLDQTVVRNVKDPGTGAPSTPSVDTRSRFSATVAIVKGTPAASPVAPALPAGSLMLAFADVPATSGATVARDARPILHVGWLGGPPRAPYSKPKHVHPGVLGFDLQVAESTPNAMTVVVVEGRAVFRSVAYFYPQETLAIAAADPTDPRIDLVVANDNGTLSVKTGTPAPAPVSPTAIGLSEIGVAQVAVAALAVTVVNANITDVRDRKWVEGDAIDFGSVPEESRTVPYNANAFSLNAQDVQVVEPNNGGLVSSINTLDSTRGYHVPRLPDGATVTSVSMGINVVDALFAASFKLWRVDRTTGTALAVAGGAYSAGTGAQVIVDSAPVSNVIDNTAYSYSLELDVGRTGLVGGTVGTVFDVSITHSTADVLH